MKKLFWLMIISLSVLKGYGQDYIYYSSAFNSKDDSLKFKLNQIIKNHTQYSYTSSSTDVWDILKETDRDTNNPDNVILIYSGRSVDAAQEYNSGSGWSREHVWAKSRGDFGTNPGAGTDVHHLRPCDISVNSTRNNRNFDACISCVDVIDNGFNTHSKRDANLWTFEPPDAVKGDVARMIFYMAVRYEGYGNEPDLELTNTLLTNTDKNPLHSVLSTLLDWNRVDSVSDWERNRNQIIYTNYQGNKNPFIDYPEIAEHLWGDSIGVVWMPKPADTTVSTGINEINSMDVNIFPNPVNDNMIVDFGNNQIENTSIELLSITGQIHGQWNMNKGSNSIKINVSNFASGVYFLKISSSEFNQLKMVIIK